VTRSRYLEIAGTATSSDWISEMIVPEQLHQIIGQQRLLNKTRTRRMCCHQTPAYARFIYLKTITATALRAQKYAW
jgi:predicted protein tyrosine phosphatase